MRCSLIDCVIARVALYVVLLGTGARVAQAQRTGGTLPFRAGQWAAMFGLASGAQSVGLLRFSSPRTAWLLDGSANVNRTSGDGDVTSTLSAINLRVGGRRYHPVENQIVTHAGAGLLAGWSQARLEGDGGSGFSKTWSAGAYVELGGDYLLTPHLAVGASGMLQAWYAHTHQHNDAATAADHSAHTWQLTAPGIRAVATLYF